MARRYDSEAVRNRVLSTSVRLFLERGYHGTTMAAILKEADVSSSSFQNVFSVAARVATSRATDRTKRPPCLAGLGWAAVRVQRGLLRIGRSGSP